MINKALKKTLLIDAGNSRLKWASLNKLSLSRQRAMAYGENTPINCFAELLKSLEDDHQQIVLVSVLGDDFIGQASSLAKESGLAFFSISSLAQLGTFKNAYLKPAQLGADRFVAMFAAYSQCQESVTKQNVIVIDCGTALTIDAISANGQHLGGLILPGQDLCNKSLLDATRQLDLSAEQSTHELLAKDTNQAILSGSFYGISGAIQHICSTIEKQVFGGSKQQKITKIICGGGAEVLESQLPTDYHYKADLVMQGLKLIAENHLHLWQKDNKTRLQ